MTIYTPHDYDPYTGFDYDPMPAPIPRRSLPRRGSILMGVGMGILILVLLACVLGVAVKAWMVMSS